MRAARGAARRGRSCGRGRDTLPRGLPGVRRVFPAHPPPPLSRRARRQGLSAAFELGRLEFLGEVTCSDSPGLFLPKPRLKARPLKFSNSLPGSLLFTLAAFCEAFQVLGGRFAAGSQSCQPAIFQMRGLRWNLTAAVESSERGRVRSESWPQAWARQTGGTGREAGRFLMTLREPCSVSG